MDRSHSPNTNTVRQQRFDAACRAAAVLISRGQVVFCPVAHSHPICAWGVPYTWLFWQQHDQRHLESCDEVVVLMLDGWRESVGIQAEIAIARQLGKPVTFLPAEENPGQSRG